MKYFSVSYYGAEWLGLYGGSWEYLRSWVSVCMLSASLTS